MMFFLVIEPVLVKKAAREQKCDTDERYAPDRQEEGSICSRKRLGENKGKICLLKQSDLSSIIFFLLLFVYPQIQPLAFSLSHFR